MSTAAAQKAGLRSVMLQNRLAVPQDIWSRNSDKIIENLYGFPPFAAAACVHTYVSMNSRNEVNTHKLIRRLLREQKKVLTSVTDFETMELRHTELLNFDDLIPNKWGVPEPPEPVSSETEPDVILVPLLAADRQFNRLGYGKGFYDRFLKQTQALKIGLLFSDFLLDKIPAESFDQKLDVLVTEEKVIQAGRL